MINNFYLSFQRLKHTVKIILVTYMFSGIIKASNFKVCLLLGAVNI